MWDMRQGGHVVLEEAKEDHVIYKNIELTFRHITTNDLSKNNK